MDFLNQFTSHSSVRSFERKDLPEELKMQLLQAAQSGSSSNFVQAYSIIEIRDPDKRHEIEQIANGMGHVENTGVFYLFVADLNRNYQIARETTQDLKAITSMESLIVSIIDTTIAAQNMAVFAESQGLGICYIGGIRNDLDRISEMLELPAYTFPLYGLTIGYPKNKNEVKPRLFAEEILKIDRYQEADPVVIAEYDQRMNHYYQQRSRNTRCTDWSQRVQAHYHTLRRPEVFDFLVKQGFDFPMKEQ
ncbi:NADPH-dependent oxidoreductase [Enterococcus olivae]